MVSFQVSGQPALRFKVAARAVLFAGSRRGQVEQPVCRALVERFRRHGFGFFVGCAAGVDAAFRAALAHSACGPDEVFVGCAFGQRARRCRAEGLFASAVVPEGIPPNAALARRTLWLVKRSSLVGLFPERPADRQWGSGSRLAIARRSTTSSRPSWWPHSRLSLRRSVGWWPPTCSPRSTATGWCPIPSATASATTSTEGRERSIGFPLTGKATPMHSPALADLLGRLPAPPPDQRSSPQPPTSCRGLWAVCHGWHVAPRPRQGRRGLGASSAILDPLRESELHRLFKIPSHFGSNIRVLLRRRARNAPDQVNERRAGYGRDLAGQLEAAPGIVVSAHHRAPQTESAKCTGNSSHD